VDEEEAARARMLQGGVRRMQQRSVPSILRRAATATATATATTSTTSRACTEEELRDQVRVHLTLSCL